MTAKEARAKSNTVRNAQIQAAKELALSEWGTNLVSKIDEACKAGNYSVGYSWDAVFFKDKQVHPYDFQDAIIAVCEDLGYAAKVSCECRCGSVVKIYIELNWKGEEK